MSFSPDTGLVYLPSQDLPAPYLEDAGFEHADGFWNTGIDFRTLETPADPAIAAEVAKMVRGQLVAWDPVRQREVWRYQHPGPWNGGTLATAGGLVFQGSLVGEFAAYDAANGERLWVSDAQTGVAAAPATYTVDGEQYVAVSAGWGSIFALLGGEALASLGLENRSRILAYKRGGSAALPELPPPASKPLPEPPEQTAGLDTIAAGKALYYQRCVTCHGVDVASGGITPDLRYSPAEVHDAWDAIVLEGVFRDRGMPAFDSIFDKADSQAVRAFVIDAAHKAYARQQ
jgi:mono/diheme cytochrome c family protein